VVESVYQKWVFVNTVITSRIPQNAANFVYEAY